MLREDLQLTLVQILRLGAELERRTSLFSRKVSRLPCHVTVYQLVLQQAHNLEAISTVGPARRSALSPGHLDVLAILMQRHDPQCTHTRTNRLLPHLLNPKATLIRPLLLRAETQILIVSLRPGLGGSGAG